MTASALGELCANVLYADGVAAAGDVAAGAVTDALDRVVEANTLLSGIGFESGGLAGAHAYAQGYTNVAHVERNYLHGEMVAMGVTAQLMMEGDSVEAERVAAFSHAWGCRSRYRRSAWQRIRAPTSTRSSPAPNRSRRSRTCRSR